MDLLLFLVKKREMNIRDIQIAVIADDFIAYLETLKKMDFSVTSDFLVMASSLMELKSKTLLAQDQGNAEEAESARKQLVHQIEEYERLKDFTAFLERKEEEATKTFPTRAKKENAQRLLNREIPSRLYDVFKQAYQELKLREKVYRVKGEKYSLSKRVEQLLLWLSEGQTLWFEDLFTEAEDRIDLIVTFLAALEIIKLEKGIYSEEFGRAALRKA
ncbi:MAG TPA: segregation/condensation protein A [Thermotogota bacterium]|mgnify:FL=1|nr:segregation/condensation protein A [Thermotogota bacterium]HNT96019.1 segregation/condensation protein A [Thermotogota bacterium]HPB87345.1 segregation/condensation protein A [Thermotogota bacterium]HPM21577.1 segregation/condensation protein A [Thermotogota bacterium]HQN22150.1 segregation/condensation protein A [Thermotogota bacterium]